MKNCTAHPGLYLHVPFCRHKCPYCDFYSTTDRSLIPRLLAALEKEAAYYRDQFPSFDTLYLGGGSPSILSGDQIESLLARIRDRFSFDPEAEITIEVNPNDLDPDKIKDLSRAGINRISLGVQSFDDQILHFLRRRHTAAEAEETVYWIRQAGFKNMGMDLIYGIPGQTINQWLADLEKAFTFRPEHLSCYQLTIAQGTLFGGLKEKGALQPLSEEEEADFFLSTSAFLKQHGYIHYEISNFALEENYFSRHNQKYWQREPYLGLGPSAHSFRDNRRWWNIRSLNKYCRALEGGEPPPEGQEELSEEQVRLETISLGLRTRAGLDLEALGIHWNREKTLTTLLGNEWAELKGNRLIPTTKGFLQADRLPLFF
ncbi:MAG: radical SAM family heme chaperone HemW [Thermodesulfobacteriota bacterium]